MKIIDKTPFQNAQGQVDMVGRLRGTLEHGPNWYPELQAQKTVIAALERLLDKGFAVIRNFNLPGSDIVVPIILVGTHGISVIYATHLRGHYEAKGDQWNRLDNNRSLPANINLLTRVTKLARATQIYFEHQQLKIPGLVEPVLICADPGLQVESMRPVARVVMSDAINQFAGSLIQSRPALRSEQVYDLAERIVTPHEPEPAPAAAEQSPAAPKPAPVAPSSQAGSEQPPVSRAKAIFAASEKPAPSAFDSSDLSFAFDEGEGKPSPQSAPPGLRETSPAIPLPTQTAPQKGKILGMTLPQIGCLGVMAIVECCILIGGAYYIFFVNR